MPENDICKLIVYDEAGTLCEFEGLVLIRPSFVLHERLPLNIYVDSQTLALMNILPLPLLRTFRCAATSHSTTWTKFIVLQNNLLKFAKLRLFVLKAV